MVVQVLPGCPSRFAEVKACARDMALGGLPGLVLGVCGGVFRWCAGSFGLKGSAGSFGLACGFFLANAFPACVLPQPIGFPTVCLLSLLGRRSSPGTAPRTTRLCRCRTGSIGGPTRTTTATARLVPIGGRVVVELAAKGEGGPAVTATSAVLLGSLLLAVVVLLVKATSLGRGLVIVWVVVILPLPAHAPLCVYEYV
jgi:hypothetical protein